MNGSSGSKLYLAAAENVVLLSSAIAKESGEDL